MWPSAPVPRRTDDRVRAPPPRRDSSARHAFRCFFFFHSTPSSRVLLGRRVRKSFPITLLAAPAHEHTLSITIAYRGSSFCENRIPLPARDGPSGQRNPFSRVCATTRPHLFRMVRSRFMTKSISHTGRCVYVFKL